MMRVCHVTSGHARRDTRVFLKECRTLQQGGFDVTLVVADGQGDASSEGVQVRDVGRPRSRWDRFTRIPRHLRRAALLQDAELYHLHDPELLPVALLLRRGGRRVVFDSHEDVAAQLLDKPYLGRWLGRAASWLFAALQAAVLPRLSGVIAATPAIGARLASSARALVVVNNFPLRDELEAGPRGRSREGTVCYVGAIAAERGVREVVKAMALVKSEVNLELAGAFDDSALKDEVSREPGWKRVRALGPMDRGAVRDLMARSLAGVVTFLPRPNHVESQPNKMFEYMSAGIPVIASDFPLWREIVGGNDCGILVNPEDPAAIARAIDSLATRPEEAARLGHNGRRAIEERYNWEAQSPLLLDFYRQVLRT